MNVEALVSFSSCFLSPFPLPRQPAQADERHSYPQREPGASCLCVPILSRGHPPTTLHVLMLLLFPPAHGSFFPLGAVNYTFVPVWVELKPHSCIPVHLTGTLLFFTLHFLGLYSPGEEGFSAHSARGEQTEGSDLTGKFPTSIGKAERERGGGGKCG